MVQVHYTLISNSLGLGRGVFNENEFTDLSRFS